VGLTAVDAGLVIAVLDRDDFHHESARKALGAARDRHDDLAVPASALAEALVGAARQGDEAVGIVTDFVRRLPASVVPVDEAVVIAAARLRARHGAKLKLPDALVVAIAEVRGASHLPTTDRGWPGPRSLGFRGQVVLI
jgi:predicted nucleic acid-binding protein